MCHGNVYGTRGGYGHASKGMGGFGDRWAHAHGSGPSANWYQPPVNIEELEDRYEIHLAAPGRSKVDFQLSVQGYVLTIACRKQEEGNLATPSNWTRREFRTVAFERQFTLNEKIDAEGIAASYNDGVLVVKLPKLPGAQTPAKDFFVA